MVKSLTAALARYTHEVSKVACWCNCDVPNYPLNFNQCYLDHTLIRLYFIFPPAANTCFKQPQTKVMEDKLYEDDSIEAPPCFNKLEPERQGKLVWESLSGPPGLGKSTTAQLLSRKHGYVYYEGDCFFMLRNPYIPPNAPEASLASLEQNKLVGAGVQEREEMAVKVVGQFRKMFAGEQVDYQVIEDDIVIALVIVIVVVVVCR